MAEDTVAFEGTPLAEYLGDEGLSDWGIEPPTDSTDWRPDKSWSEGWFADNGDINTVKPFKNKKTRFEGHAFPAPIILDPNFTPPSVRRLRFKSLIRLAVKSSLSQMENSQFLERFRYVLISSRLLDDHISLTRYHQTTDESKTPSFRSPWDELRMPKKYWVGGGGCILVVVVILWAFKDKLDGEQQNSCGRTATLVVTLAVALFLFGHSRRRMMRLLRAQALAYTPILVQNSHDFDDSLSTCMSIIREIELFSQGYRPDLVGGEFEGRFRGSRHPDSQTEIRGKHLRASVSAALYLATTSILDAIRQCMSWCTALDLEKYLDIYNLNLDRLDEFGWRTSPDSSMNTNDINDNNTNHTNNTNNSFTRDPKMFLLQVIQVPRDEFYGANGSSASSHKLKQSFYKLHFVRRVFVCCLLSIHTSGEFSAVEISSWSDVVKSIKNSSDLFAQLSKTLTPMTTFEPSNEPSNQFPSQISINNSNETPAWSRHMRSLNGLSATLRHIEARMQMLKDNWIHMSKSDYDVSPYVKKELDENYDLVGENIESLLDIWKQGKFELSQMSDCNEHDEKSSQGDTSILDPLSHDNSYQFSPQSPSMSVISMATTLADERDVLNLKFGDDFKHERNNSLITNSSGMTILEGIADRSNRNSKSVLSRQERIERMKRERVLDMKKKVVTNQRNSFVLELGSVLERRRISSYPEREEY